jgi:hypothetical protein
MFAPSNSASSNGPQIQFTPMTASPSSIPSEYGTPGNQFFQQFGNNSMEMGLTQAAFTQFGGQFLGKGQSYVNSQVNE